VGSGNLAPHKRCACSIDAHGRAMTAAAETFFAATLLGSSVYLILWLFFIYSFLGVIVEMIFCLVVEGVLESRSGLLYVPLRPIYGLGGVAMTLFLQVSREPVLLFLFGMLVASVIEYGAGLVVEKAFGTVAWDYSNKRWNLHGRICLQFSLCWGLLALLVGYVLDPFFFSVVTAVDRSLGEMMLAVLLLATLLAGMITAAALLRIRKRVTALGERVPNEPTSVPARVWERLIDRLAPEPLIINSFPRTSLVMQYMQLSGAQRDWIRVPIRPSREPSDASPRL
jgi:uncharacterized membrane protein